MSDAERHHLDPAIHRVRLDKLTIFEITEAELEALERGSPESLYLNLGVGVASIAISFSIALLSTEIQSTKTFCFCRSLKTVAQEIRRRRAPEGIQEDDRAKESAAEGEH